MECGMGLIPHIAFTVVKDTYKGDPLLTTPVQRGGTYTLLRDQSLMRPSQTLDKLINVFF